LSIDIHQEHKRVKNKLTMKSSSDVANMSALLKRKKAALESNREISDSSTERISNLEAQVQQLQSENKQLTSLVTLGNACHHYLHSLDIFILQRYNI